MPLINEPNELFPEIQPKDIRTHAPSDELVIPDTFIGVEVELERVDNFRMDGLWETKTDGSLHDGGLEYVFRFPLRGQDVVDALETFEEAMTELRPKIGNDTSLHVHVDVRDMNMQQVMSFIMLYFMYEKVLFNVFSPEREDNIFCLALSKAKGNNKIIANLLQAIQRGHGRTIRDIITTMERYGGININAISHFGTLEFRGHSATYRKDEILKWVNMLLSLKRMAMVGDIEWRRPYLGIKSEGSTAFTEMVFGDMAHLLHTPTFHEDLHDGMQLVRLIANYNEDDIDLIDFGAPKGNKLFKNIFKIASRTDIDAIYMAILEHLPPVTSNRVRHAIFELAEKHTDFAETILELRRDQFLTVLSEYTGNGGLDAAIVSFNNLREES